MRDALQFLYFAGMPAVEAKLFRSSGDMGLAKGVNDWLPPDQQALSPTFPANANGKRCAWTMEFWRDNLAKLRPLVRGVVGAVRGCTHRPKS